MADKKQKKSQLKVDRPLKKEVKQTKDLLSDLNSKINNNQVSEKEKRLTLIATHKKITNLLLKTTPYLMILFILDVVMLTTITVLFLVSAFALKDVAQVVTRFVVLGLAAFMLIKFTYMNWFSKNLYFKKIVVFKYKSKVDKQKFRAVREISFTPIWFLIFFVASNLWITIIVNFELQNTFAQSGGNELVLIWAVFRTTIDMMLLPSFLNSFNKIADNSKSVDANYIKLIKDQYFSNKSLFDDVEFEDNYLNLKFSKNNLVSKNGLFILVNKDELTRPDQGRMIEINNEILDRYKEIWESYVDLLENRMKAKFNKATVHKLFWLERIYDTIFLDLFEI
ncbi:hypothetical protein [Mesoplasma melaleucae]|uniref:Uncharacterized protein n=1 Tax=Mesoplasma melaleucae TaxID=81459 RepID=A0A2K8NW09_9MOLU|nr:hypothetical protein [Mesoplasma melaleucae]ATZ18022.1 hypothetical protein EMELA_v1c04790 [Mesoplasma melaleucae]